jgi:GxxExxY protein
MNLQHVRAGTNEPDEECDRLAYSVIGAAIEVHRHLGPGYLEVVYEDAMEVELKIRGISFERQKHIALNYKGHPVGEGRIDLLVEGILVVELKAVEALAPIHRAQVISYLKMLRLPLGALINFNVPVVSKAAHRMILTQGNGRDAESS